MSHAQRFDAVGAQKGSALYGVVTALKQVAMVAEDSYDPNSPQVVGAMQRFEQGLALLVDAPERPQETESEQQEESATDGEQEGESSDAPVPTRRKPRKTAKDSEDAS